MKEIAEVHKLFKDSKYAEALRIAEYLISKEPFNPLHYRLKGKLLWAMKFHVKALEAMNCSLSMVGPNAEDLSNRGMLKNEIGDYPGVIEDFTYVINAGNGNSKIYLTRGAAFWEMARYDEADADFKKSYEIDPNDTEVEWVNGLFALQFNDFKNGWPGYESRWKSSRFKSRKMITRKPMWTPDVGLKSVLVWSEQGLGDQVFYSSMLEAVEQRVDQVHVVLSERLIPVLSQSFPNIKFYDNAKDIPDIGNDCHLPMASIGGRFIKEKDDIAKVARRNYLQANPENAARLRAMLPEGKPIVGLSWTSLAPKVGVHKSIPTDALRPILKLPNVTFVDLQYAESLGQLEYIESSMGVKVHKLPINIRDDVQSTLDLMSICDQIVGCSSTTIHLAGALGRPVLLMDSNKLWYWGNKDDNNHSLWYPTIKIFSRKNVMARWDNVSIHVRDELFKRVHHI